MSFSKLQQFTDKFGIFLIPTFIFPVHPADPVILTIGIVIAVLGISVSFPLQISGIPRAKQTSPLRCAFAFL